MRGFFCDAASEGCFGLKLVAIEQNPKQKKIMKKSVRILAVALLAMVSVTANAQMGVKVGYVNASTKFKGNGATFSPSSQSGFSAGVNYDIGLPVSGLSIRPGIDYIYIGGNSIFSDMIELGDDFDGNLRERDHSISVPVDLKYAYDITDRINVYGFAGPRFVVGVASVIKMSQDGQTGSLNLYTGHARLNGSRAESEDVGAVLSRFDMQLGIGAGVSIRPLFIETGYNWGLLNRLHKDLSDGVTMKRGVFFVNVGLLF